MAPLKTFYTNRGVAFCMISKISKTPVLNKKTNLYIDTRQRTEIAFEKAYKF